MGEGVPPELQVPELITVDVMLSVTGKLPLHAPASRLGSMSAVPGQPVELNPLTPTSWHPTFVGVQVQSAALQLRVSL